MKISAAPAVLLVLLALLVAAKISSAVDVSEVDIGSSMYTILVDAESEEAEPYHHPGKTRGQIALRPSFISKIRATAAAATGGPMFSSAVDDFFPAANLLNSHSYVHNSDVITSMTSLTTTSEAHIDIVLQHGDRPLMPRDDKVGLVFLNTNDDAHFDVDDTCIPVQRNRLVLFDGGKSVHRTVVKKGRVSLVGPFHTKTFVGVGAGDCVFIGGTCCPGSCVSPIVGFTCGAGETCCSSGASSPPDACGGAECEIMGGACCQVGSCSMPNVEQPLGCPAGTICCNPTEDDACTYDCAAIGGLCCPADTVCYDQFSEGIASGCGAGESCCGICVEITSCSDANGECCTDTCTSPLAGTTGCSGGETCCEPGACTIPPPPTKSPSSPPTSLNCEFYGGSCCQSCLGLPLPVPPGRDYGCATDETCCEILSSGDSCDNDAGGFPICSGAVGECCADTCTSPVAGTTGCSGGKTCCDSGACVVAPTNRPSSSPSSQPSSLPSHTPSNIPSSAPSNQPSSMPSDVPSRAPSSEPSDSPSTIPSDAPSHTPSSAPSDIPSSLPSTDPSSSPSSEPSKRCERECTIGKSKSGTKEDGCTYYRYKKMEEAIHHIQAVRRDGNSLSKPLRLPKCDYRCIPESALPSPSFPKEFIHVKGQKLRGNRSSSDNSDSSSSESDSDSSSSGHKEQIWYQYGRNGHLPGCRDPPPAAPKELK